MTARLYVAVEGVTHWRFWPVDELVNSAERMEPILVVDDAMARVLGAHGSGTAEHSASSHGSIFYGTFSKTFAVQRFYCRSKPVIDT